MNHPKEIVNHGKILIADDDLINQRLLSYQLRELPDELIFAKNGNEALRLFKENDDVRLIIMDMQMPEMNGVEATRKILELDPEAKIIGLSAFEQGENDFGSENVGFVDYVTKPINKAALLEVIGKHLA